MFDKPTYQNKNINWDKNSTIVGIYKITSPKNKIYIGQSWNIFKRWKAYKIYKGKGQPFLQNSFSKYGVENHKFEILCILPQTINQKILDYHEILYWDSYLYNNNKMLNVKEPGSCGKLPQIVKDKIGKSNSISLLGKKQTQETVEKRITAISKAKRDGRNKIIQYSLQGEKIKEWSCIAEASEKLSIPNANIYRCLTNFYGRKSAGGYKWTYFDAEIKESYLNNQNKQKRKIIQEDLNGNFIKEWDSVSKASKKTGINRANITMAALGHQKTSGGFKWKYS
jgi:hypothetical protein